LRREIERQVAETMRVGAERLSSARRIGPHDWSAETWRGLSSHAIGEVWIQSRPRDNRQQYNLAISTSIKLLRDWLTPEQLADFDRQRAFDVVGSHSKDVYTIREGTAHNVTRRRDGATLCFGPPGLPVGDVMLAQKMTLEKNETEALRVANFKRRIRSGDELVNNIQQR
jgi:hypothetical protein